MNEKEIDWLGYEKEFSKNRELFWADIENASKAMFEYGMMIIKYLILLNGGALVALPAIAKFIGSSGQTEVFYSALLFVLGLVLAVICAYSAHLNWLFLSSAYLMQQITRGKRITHSYLGEEYQSESELLEEFKAKDPYRLRVKLSFWATHFFGILSLVCFSAACFSVVLIE